MTKSSIAKQCCECRAKVPKKSYFPGWIQDKAIDLCDVSSGIVPKIHPSPKKSQRYFMLLFFFVSFIKTIFPFFILSLDATEQSYKRFSKTPIVEWSEWSNQSIWIPKLFRSPDFSLIHSMWVALRDWSDCNKREVWKEKRMWWIINTTYTVNK